MRRLGVGFRLNAGQDKKDEANKVVNKSRIFESKVIGSQSRRPLLSA